MKSRETRAEDLKRWIKTHARPATPLVARYKEYREAYTHLNHKIMKRCLSRQTLMHSASLLGIAWGKTLIFESEDQMSTLMDFALHEHRVRGRNAIQTYVEEVGWENDVEKSILSSLLGTRTSLFQVLSISEREPVLEMRDLLSGGGAAVIDLAFSASARPGVLMFLRLIPFGDLHMTSGMAFAFPGFQRETLLRDYRKEARRMKGNREMKRFLFFFRQNTLRGIDVTYL